MRYRPASPHLEVRPVLAVKTYDPQYIDDCYSQMEAQLAAYKFLVAGADANGASSLRAAFQSFEPLFFNNLILVLDAYFVHRTRASEGKDGNPLNEVRLLGASILSHRGVLAADKTIKYKPEASILKIKIGDEIRIGEAAFLLLFRAFFTELRRRFT
jgi:hypothetical protein